MDPLFTVDLEEWDEGLHMEGDHSSDFSVLSLLSTLRDFDIGAVFYTTKKCWRWKKLLESDGHIVRTHGEKHVKGEVADREPYAKLGFTGGFWFRFLPLWLLKWNIKRKGFFYIHPHDLDDCHPIVNNWFLNCKRHWGLKKSKKKLTRLLNDVRFRNANASDFQ